MIALKIAYTVVILLALYGGFKDFQKADICARTKNLPGVLWYGSWFLVAIYVINSCLHSLVRL